MKLFENWLHRFPALNSMDERAKARLLNKAMLVDVEADKPVFQRRDPCDHYLFVLYGCVRVQVSSESGREIVLYRVRTGETCVINAASLFAGADYVADAITEERTRAAALPSSVFKELISESPVFRDFVLREHGVRLIEIVATLEDVTFVRVERRLATMLLNSCDPQDWVMRTHQQLASELGSSREVVSRCLKDFERHGWVKIGRGAINLRNKSALCKVSSSDPGMQQPH